MARKTGKPTSAPIHVCAYLLLLVYHGRHCALRSTSPLADTIFHNLLDPLGNAMIPLHQRMQVVSLQPQQIGTGDRGNCGSAAGPAQQRHLAEKLAYAQPDVFLFALELDVDLTGSDEI